MNDLKRRPRKERVFLRKIPEGFAPADNYAHKLLQMKKICNGDIIAANISKLRTLGSNKNAHKIAIMCHDNIETFSNYTDYHEVLKRLQIESGAACEEIGVNLNGMWCTVRYPLSFSFDSLGESEFLAAVKTICRYISEKYWPSMTAEQIEEMAERFVNE